MNKYIFLMPTQVASFVQPVILPISSYCGEEQENTFYLSDVQQQIDLKHRNRSTGRDKSNQMKGKKKQIKIIPFLFFK